jgi:hypothetical protein
MVQVPNDMYLAWNMYFLYRTFIWNVLHFEKIQWDIINILVIIYSASHFFLILTKLEFSWQILIKVPIIKSHKNLASGRKVVPCMKAGTQEDLMKQMHAFPNPMKKPKHLHTHKYDFLRLWNLTSYLYFLKLHWLKFCVHMVSGEMKPCTCWGSTRFIFLSF